MACDMPEPCKFPSLDSCQKRFLWTHKEVDLAPHPVIDFMLHVGDVEKFLLALGFESLNPGRGHGLIKKWTDGTRMLAYCI